MRPGAEYFTAPSGAGQRRYEALRAYFTEEATAAEVADRFGYSTASVHQMATLLRTGKLDPFTETKPGPKGPRKATGALRDKVLAVRAEDRSIDEIAEALAAAGTPISAQTVWGILDDAGLPRLARRDEGRRGPPARLQPVKAGTLAGWPAAAQIRCDHAGLLLLFPAMANSVCTNWSPRPATRAPRRSPPGSPSAPCCWPSAHAGPRASHRRADRRRRAGVRAGADRAAQGHPRGLLLLPGAPRIQPSLLTGLVKALRGLGMASGTAGFNLDFHAIRHHGDHTALEKHYVPRRSQRTRAVLTFFAQDHASTEMVYANAEITKAEQAREIIAFADYWQHATGEDPGLLVFDSQLTTYKVLDELTARGIGWLTLRQRGHTELARLPPYPRPSGKPPPSAAPAATGARTCTKT